MTETEVWRDIAGYEGIYQVSNMGRVKSLDRITSNGQRRKGQIILPRKNKCGYYQICLSKNNVKHSDRINRLVATAFIPNPQRLPEVNHINENLLDNTVYNLEWCDRKTNINHGTRTERAAEKLSKPVVGTRISDGSVIEFKSSSEAGRNGFCQSAVSRCCRKVKPQYKGYIWKFKSEEDAS